jgi:Domain of unknown function (DUF4373)
MKKDAYYFSHDANAQDDPKCMKLLDEMGTKGYGIFWLLIEKLRAEKDYTLPTEILPILAKRWGENVESLEQVVKKYDLFKKVKGKFFSVRLKNSMFEKSERAKSSASKRWSDATALQPHSDRNATAMRNDAIKVKEKKEKESSDFFPSGIKKGMVL